MNVIMYTVCTDYVENGTLDEYLEGLVESEKKFTNEIGVLFRKFFQCKIQPHVIWAVTEWDNAKSHHDAAQSILKTRRDDRFASVAFGPTPYFEIFCNSDESLSVGEFLNANKFFIVVHGLINEKLIKEFLDIRRMRFEEVKHIPQWMRVFHNISNRSEFVAFLGFSSEEVFNKVRKVDDFYLEEYLFTGIKEPLGMSQVAAYNQFICEQIVVSNLKIKE